MIHITYLAIILGLLIFSRFLLVEIKSNLEWIGRLNDLIEQLEQNRKLRGEIILDQQTEIKELKDTIRVLEVEQ